jgi:hypothetical protein
VTIKFDNPPPQVHGAEYYFYEHLGSIAVKSGQHVVSSQIIGTNGSQSAMGSQKVPLGFGLYAGPIYGGGGAWKTTQAQITTKYNPVPVLEAAIAGTLPGLIDPETGGVDSSSNGSGGSVVSGGTPVSVPTSGIFGLGTVGSITGETQTYTPVLAQTHAALVSNGGFKGIASALDVAEQFPGWIDLGGSFNAGPFQLPDPAGFVRSIGATITDNFVPFIFRSGIVSLGLLLLILLITKVLMDTGVVQDAVKVAALAG